MWVDIVMSMFLLPIVLATTQSWLDINEAKKRLHPDTEFYSCRFEKGGLEKPDPNFALGYVPDKPYSPETIAAMPLLHYAIDKAAKPDWIHTSIKKGMLEDVVIKPIYNQEYNSHLAVYSRNKAKDPNYYTRMFSLNGNTLEFSYTKTPLHTKKREGDARAPHQYRFTGTCRRVTLETWAQEMEEKYLKQKRELEQQGPVIDPGLS